MLTKEDLSQIQKVIKEEVSDVRKDIRVLKGDVSKIRTDINTIISMFDWEYVNLRDRVEVIEEKLGYASLT